MPKTKHVFHGEVTIAQWRRIMAAEFLDSLPGRKVKFIVNGHSFDPGSINVTEEAVEIRANQSSDVDMVEDDGEPVLEQ